MVIIRNIHKRLQAIALLLATSLVSLANGIIYSNKINTLQVTADNDFLSPAVITMGYGQQVKIAFDEMSHDYRRLTYHIEHCNPDWTTSDKLLESEYLEGFNDNVIDNYNNSINTTVLYTHYSFYIPNERCQIKLSGNYRVTVKDDDTGERLLEARFRIVDPKTDLAINVKTNTDIDVNSKYQQLSMTLGYQALNITNPDEEIFTIVTQNDREDNMRVNVRPNVRNRHGMEWSHNRELIFDGGNEYRKYEILSLSHPTMGIETMEWDGQYYHASTFTDEPRTNYVYDEDADGSFYIRNSENKENDITSDYVFVNYRLTTDNKPKSPIMIDGRWTTHADKNRYVMKYDEETRTYCLQLLQKQGYYSYQYLSEDNNGEKKLLKSEGNFFETENRYQVYIYYKRIGERMWQLVGFRQLIFK